MKLQYKSKLHSRIQTVCYLSVRQSIRFIYQVFILYFTMKYFMVLAVFIAFAGFALADDDSGLKLFLCFSSFL